LIKGALFHAPDWQEFLISDMLTGLHVAGLKSDILATCPRRKKSKMTKVLKIVSVRLDPYLIQRIKVRAAQQNVKMETWISDALIAALKRREGGEQ
jgi:predicted HicB family RNase H-like nuclease